MKPERRLKRFNKLAASPKYKSQEILGIMNPRPGMIIADVGSGGGFYTQAFAKAVAPDGLVVAVDTDSRNLEYIEESVKAMGMDNVKTFVTPADHLELPARQYDWIFMRDMYHHIADPSTYFQFIARFLKPRGLVVLIDYTKPRSFAMSFSGLRQHYSDPAKIRYVMQQEGLDLFRSFKFLPNQSFQIFGLRQ